MNDREMFKLYVYIYISHRIHGTGIYLSTLGHFKKKQVPMTHPWVPWYIFNYCEWLICMVK